MASCILLRLVATGPDRSIWLDYTKTLLVLGGVCFLAIFATKFMLPRISGMGGRPQSEHIEIIARQTLEPRKTLYLIRAGKSALLLASSADTIQLLAALDSQELKPIDRLGDAIDSSAREQAAQTFTGRNKETS